MICFFLPWDSYRYFQIFLLTKWSVPTTSPLQSMKFSTSFFQLAKYVHVLHSQQLFYLLWLFLKIKDRLKQHIRILWILCPYLRCFSGKFPSDCWFAIFRDDERFENWKKNTSNKFITIIQDHALFVNMPIGPGFAQYPPPAGPVQ